MDSLVEAGCRVTDPRETGGTDPARRGPSACAMQGYVSCAGYVAVKGFLAPGAPALWWEVMLAPYMLRLLLAAVLVVLGVGLVAWGGEPALLTPEQAALATVDGLKTGEFEIHFPKRFTRVMKLLALLPYGWYFPLVRRLTGS